MESPEAESPRPPGPHALLARMSPTRIRLLYVLASGTDAPKEAAQRLGLSPVTVYNHLTALKALGMVHLERTGRYTRYSIASNIEPRHIRTAFQRAVDSLLGAFPD